MRISDWSSDVCSSDLIVAERHNGIVVATQGDLRAVRLIGGHRQPHGGIDHRARGCLEPPALLGIGVELAEMGGSNAELGRPVMVRGADEDRKSTSELQSLMRISYAVFCLKKQHQYH